MNFIKTTIPDCFIVQQDIHTDTRGAFVKMFRKSFFDEHHLETAFTEQYYTESTKGVVRGMHFQTPPQDHAKLVTIIQGTVIDVILDIRKGSPTFGRHEAFELSRENGKSIYIPRGCAHGFCAMTDHATTFYMVSSEYDPRHDTGIAFNSFGYKWPFERPIQSGRDTSFKPLAEFDSPFTFG